MNTSAEAAHERRRDGPFTVREQRVAPERAPQSKRSVVDEKKVVFLHVIDERAHVFGDAVVFHVREIGV